jgi:hypothetical protein
MAQSALTVTAPNPTPPTNMSCTGATPPNVPNFTKLTYADWLDNTKFDSAAPPFFDDGTAGALVTFATNTAALASGTGATSGGTENTYPGTGAYSTHPAAYGAVPASTSVAHEGAGTEVSVLAPGNLVLSYPGSVTMNTSQSASCGPTIPAPTMAAPVPASPNATHASSLSPATNPTLTSVTGASNVSGVGTTTLTATGTGFTRQSVIVSNGISYPTTFVSATSLTCTAAKKATAGTLPVYVITGGVVQTATVNWTFT